MNIKVASFDVSEVDDETEGHTIRVRPGGPLDSAVPGPKRVTPASELVLDVSVEGNMIVFRDADADGDEAADDDDAEGHAWRRARFVELGNDVVEVSDSNGMVRRYVRVGGSSHTPDAVSMKYRLGGGPRIWMTDGGCLCSRRGVVDPHVVVQRCRGFDSTAATHRRRLRRSDRASSGHRPTGDRCSRGRRARHRG